MKIHKYDNQYAAQNKIDWGKEQLIACAVGVFGLIPPAILLGVKVINFWTTLIIYIIVISAVVYFIRKTGIIKKSLLSVIIEDKNKLYYMTIMPNFHGSLFPKTFTALLAGPSATFVENKTYAEMMAEEMAQDDKVITALFNLYQKNELRTTFDTIMYGKPVYVYEILDKTFRNEHKKYYRVKCKKDNNRKKVISIPNVYPTFFA